MEERRVEILLNIHIGIILLTHIDSGCRNNLIVQDNSKPVRFLFFEEPIKHLKVISSLLDSLQFPRPADQSSRKGCHVLSSFLKFSLTAAVLNLGSYDIFQALQEIIKVWLSPLKQQNHPYVHILLAFYDHRLQAMIIFSSYFVIILFKVLC